MTLRASDDQVAERGGAWGLGVLASSGFAVRGLGEKVLGLS